MADDDVAEFLRDVRAALAAAAHPIDPPIDLARRLLTWLQTAEAEEPSTGADLDEKNGVEGHRSDPP
ncbi:hypothetical protein [Methylobacterium sp. WL8]|uniref:hypothetical protein n=1 Tax=Methylobacterium sp. WL8 TaxID=2603899 RepID=UPI0011CCC493|nr:hypothetical protein [Methylobacterium sp. WL8]TXN80292.1 hypothetical protein FV234_17530 [Methylobacterium sp. WL8]